MIKKIVTASVIAASLTTSALAFEQQGVKKGNSVVGVDVRYTSTDIDAGGTTSTSSNTNANVSYSRFFTDSIEVGAYIGTMISSSPGSSDTTTQNIGVMANWNFSSVSPTMVPYVGINGAMYSSETGGKTSDENGYGAEAGLKIFVSEKASIVPAAYYQSFGEFMTQTGAKVALQVYF